MKHLKLPNLLTNPRARVAYIINGREYIFCFKWCDTFCMADIYIIKDGKKVFLIKGKSLVNGNDLIKRVKDKSLITGSLVVTNKYGDNTEPEINNFHTDFEMVYYG